MIKISKYVFGSYFKDPSNQNLKYLRTKIRNLKIPLRDSGISYDQIIKSIKNLASSKDVLSEYYQKVFKNIVKKNKGEILINLKNFKKLNIDFKIKIINDSIKILKSNYYNPRSKKVIHLINIFQSKSFKKATLGGCIFFIKNNHLCLKSEKK